MRMLEKKTTEFLDALSSAGRRGSLRRSGGVRVRPWHDGG